MKRISKIGTVAKFSAAFAVLALLSLTGCNEKKQAAKTDDGSIRIEGAFRGEEEARFQEIVKIFNEQNPQFHVVYEGSPDFEVQIQVETQANTPPDIAALPQPGTMKR
ncbi:MAG: hypothetical protein IKO39_05415 [Treponema sp.]|nr:hypothetical protein [Treponema sp.]